MSRHGPRKTDLPTIRDVATACGLSAMTVSAVLNNRPGAASDHTRARVLAMVREMGYHPNAVARGLSRRRMNTLGVVLAYDEKPSLTADRYLGPVFDGVLAASKHYHQKMLVITEDTWKRVAENLPAYLDGHADGLIFVIPFVPMESYRLLVDKKMPFVLIGESRPEPELSTVDIDNVAAARLATGHLLAMGHRRIAYLGGNAELWSSREREQGYREALDAAGVCVDEGLIVPGKYAIESGGKRARHLMRCPKTRRPTAFFCGDDWIALGAAKALAEMGLRVPEDVSLIGVNDDKEAAAMDAPLTTIRQPFRDIGTRAVEVVLAQVRGKLPGGQKVLLPGELIVRASVGPPAAKPGVATGGAETGRIERG